MVVAAMIGRKSMAALDSGERPPYGYGVCVGFVDTFMTVEHPRRKDSKSKTGGTAMRANEVSESERQRMAWSSLPSSERKRLIKDRQAFPRYGWPAAYPPDKDPLAPRPVAVLREPVQAPVASGFGF
jgi:hypothetical protein